MTQQEKTNPAPVSHLAGSQPQHVLSVTQHPNVEGSNGEQRGTNLPGQHLDGAEPDDWQYFCDGKWRHSTNPTFHRDEGYPMRPLYARPSPSPKVVGRPDGHCGDDATWEQFSKDYGDRTRADLCKGDLTDFALANAQFMCDRNSLDLIVYQTAAKERIRWLSIQLARALATEGKPDAS